VIYNHRSTTFSRFYDHISAHYHGVHDGGAALKLFSAFTYALCIVGKEGPAKNVIVNIQKYHSHIGGNEIKDSMMTMFFSA